MRTLGWTLLTAIGALSLDVTSAHAGTRVRLVPQNVSSHALNPIGHYPPGEVVIIHIYLEQTSAGLDHLLRMARFHFDASSDALEVGIGAITFAPFSVMGHFVDSSRTTGPAGIGVAYIFDAAHVRPNPAIQLLLPGNGTAALIASFPVTMPTAPGSYVLNVMNAAGPTTNDRAVVTYGFGCAANSPCAPAGSHPDGTFPVTNDLPGAGLTGGTLSLTTNTPTVLVAGVPPTPHFLGRFTHPLDGGNLWRSQQQVIRIAFLHDIGAVGNFPSCPGLEIRELRAGPTPATGANFAGGMFGQNLNVVGAFACGIESDPYQANAPRILRIFDTNPPDFRHRVWYAVQNLGVWGGAPPFRMDYRMMVGDVDNNGLINAIDVGLANYVGGLTDVCFLDSCRADIDGNRICNAIDIGSTNANIATGGWFPKPAGHP